MSAMDALPPKSKEWRDRAEEYRTFAGTATTPAGRRSYLEVAENCDRIAERWESKERGPGGGGTGRTSALL
jgi:hypothetical protein